MSLPFAVIGSNVVIEKGGKKLRGRMYPWGVAEGVFRSCGRSIFPVCIRHVEYAFTLPKAESPVTLTTTGN